MSVDLAFWKYKKGEYLNNEEVYRCGCESNLGALADGLEELPAESIKNAFCEEFKDWNVSTNGESVLFENGGHGSFELAAAKYFVRADIWSMSYDDINRITDVMLGFGCPLYDPSLPQRFDTDINI